MKKQITPYKRIDRYAFDRARFKTIDEMQEYIRNNTTEDYVVVDNLLYTMEEYDMSGKQITYHNRRTGNTILVETKDRYKLGFGDAVVSLLKNYGIYRNDIAYAD